MTDNEILHKLLHLIDGAEVVGHCLQCQRPLLKKEGGGRPPKFCSSNCRVTHWREKQREGGDHD